MRKGGGDEHGGRGASIKIVVCVVGRVVREKGDEGTRVEDERGPRHV